MVEDRGGLGLPNLQKQTDKLIGAMREDRNLIAVNTQFRSNTPQLFMDIDRTKVESLGVSLDDVNQTLQMYLGSLYINSFNAFGRYWQVTVQADGDFRRQVAEVNLLEVRNKTGQMVPLGTLVHVRDVSGPVMVMRYNLYTAAPITGGMWPGVSSGPVIASVDDLAHDSLPRTMNTEWTEIMFMQIRAGNTAMYVFAWRCVFVFLVLAAQYESWTLPLAVILVVPLCLLCSVAGVVFTHTAVDIFVQIGFDRAGGPGLQERHPDCRVRQAIARRRPAALRGHDGGMPAPPAADPDDIFCLHPGCRTDGFRQGSRRGDAPLPGHGRVLGHVGCDAFRCLSDAGVLLCH